MNQYNIYTPIHTPPLEYAQKYLLQAGFSLSGQPHPGITHVLLSVPTFHSDGTLRGGGTPEEVLEGIPKDAAVIGGNVECGQFGGRHVIDLLRDEEYTAMNAGITAHCALKIALQRLNVTLKDCRVLIIGWGRIGKCLGQLLRGLGADVTVAVRRERDKAILHALGCSAIFLKDIDPTRFRVIFNTAPAPVLPSCPGTGLKIELASVRGIGGDDVILAGGLPGTEAPESSGKLIADTILRILSERR